MQDGRHGITDYSVTRGGAGVWDGVVEMEQYTKEDSSSFVCGNILTFLYEYLIVKCPILYSYK